jgi:hypothetical protein
MWERDLASHAGPLTATIWTVHITLGVSELKVKLKPHNKTKDLIQRIKEMLGSLDRDTVAKASKRYRSRI